MLRPVFFNQILVGGLIMAVEPLISVLMLGHLGFAPWQYGLAFAAPCVGGIIGSRLSPPSGGPVRAAPGDAHRRDAAGLLAHRAGVRPPRRRPACCSSWRSSSACSSAWACSTRVYAAYRLDQIAGRRVARTLSAWSVSSSLTIAVMTALWGLLASMTSLRTAIALAGVLLLATPLLLPRRDRTPGRPGNWPAARPDPH